MLANLSARFARRASRVVRDASGQTGVLLAVMLFLFVGFGALVIDTGLWLSERRDAQADADASALAAAIELSLSADPAQQAADVAAAEARAAEWATRNGVDISEPGALSVRSVRSCFSADDGAPTGIEVALQRRPPSFFLGLLGGTEPTVSTRATACTSSRDIALVLDRSGSMCADSHGLQTICPNPPPAWRPFTQVQQAAIDFSGQFSRTYDQMALVSYSNTASVNRSLGHEFGAGTPFETAVRGLRPSGLTNIGLALATGRAQLTGAGANPEAVKVLVLLTDGAPNLYPDGRGGWSVCGGNSCAAARDYALQEAQLCADAGILVFDIGLGAGVDGAFLQSIATIGHGMYLPAPAASDLESAFRTIAEQAHARLAS